MEPYFGDEQAARVGRLIDLAKEADLKPAQLALAWLLRRPGVSSVIAGATRVSQVKENAAAASAEPAEVILRELDEVFDVPAA